MSLTTTSSYSHPSTTVSSNPAIQATSPLTAQQSRKYMQQRIKQLELDLEDTRLQLFTSEEARAKLEARLDVDTVTSTSSSATSSASTDSDSGDDAELGKQEKETLDSGLRTRQEEHERKIQALHNYFLDRITAIEKNNKELREQEKAAQLKEHQQEKATQLEEHLDSLDRLDESYEAEFKQIENGIRAQHDQEKITQANYYMSIVNRIAKRRKEELKQKGKHVRAMCEAAADKLEAQFQAEIIHMKEDHDSERAALQKDHDREQEAQVDEYETLIATHQKELEAMTAEYAAKVEDFEIRLAQVATKEAELAQREQRLEQIVDMVRKLG